MKTVKIVGLGPGHPDWILPVARNAVRSADQVVGGARQLEAVAPWNENRWLLERNYPETVEHIRNTWQQKQLAVVVSGDTGFHSLLGYLKRNLPEVDFEVIPGVSSLQYLFGRVGLSWEESRWGSCHGQALDLTPYIDEERTMGLLTDARWHPGAVCRELCRLGLGDAAVVIGENLSYPDERIRLGTASEYREEDTFDINGMLLLNAADAEAVAGRRNRHE